MPGAIGFPMGTSYPAVNPVQRMLMASALPKQMTYQGSGAVGMPMGTAYPEVQPRNVLDMIAGFEQDEARRRSHQIATAMRSGAGEGGGFDPMEVVLPPHLQRQLPPDFGEMVAGFEVDEARRQDHRKATAMRSATGEGGFDLMDVVLPPHLARPPYQHISEGADSNRTQDRNSSAFFGQARPKSDVPRTEDRNSSRYFGSSSTYDRQIQEAMTLDQQIRDLQAYVESGQGNPADASRLVSLKNQRESLRQRIDDTPDPNASGVFGPLHDIDKIDFKDVAEVIGDSPLNNRVTQYVADVAKGAGERVWNTNIPATEGLTLSEAVTKTMEAWNEYLVEPVKREIGRSIYRVATNDAAIHDLVNPFATIFAGVLLVDEQFGDGGLAERVKDAYENGYTSDTGIQFSGEMAVFEGIVASAKDNLPLPLKLAFGAILEVTTDPTSLLPIVGQAGRGIKLTGQALGAIPDASRATRLAGATARGMGTLMDTGSTALDTLGVAPVAGVIRKGTDRMGFFDQSIATQTNEAERTLRDAFGNTIRTLDQTEAERAADQAAIQADIAEDTHAGIVDAQGRPISTNGATPPTSRVPTNGKPPGAGLVDAQGNPIDSAAVKPNGVALVDANGKPKPLETPAQVAKRTDPDTGQVFPAASSVPDSMPTLRAAVTDAPRARGAARASGESLTRPVPGGTRPQDAALDRGIAAIDAGDFPTAQKANDFLAEFETASKGTIGNDPKFVAYGETTTSGTGQGRMFSVPDRVLSQADRTVLGTGKAAYGRLNGLLKQSYELSREELNNAIVGARLWTKYFPGSELPTSADSLFRTADDMTWTQERYPWLAAEYVRTADDLRADRIWAILNDPNRSDFLAVDAEGKSYLTAIPRDVVSRAGDDVSIRDLNHQMLREARNAYQEARLAPQRADHASQIGGGLSKGSQDAAAKIRKAEREDLHLLVRGTEKKAEETSKYLAETIRAADAVGIDYFNVQAMSDDLGWGPLSGLNWGQVDELRKIIDTPPERLPSGRWSDDVADDVIPEQAAPDPVVTPFKGGATITDGTDTLTVQKQGSHWEVLDADGTVIGRNPGKAHAIERAKQHFTKAGRQIKDDLTDPSVGFMNGRQSFGDRLAQGRQALIEQADTSAALGIRNGDLKWTNDRGLIPNRDATLLDKTIRGGHLGSNGTSWTVPGQNVPKHLKDAEWSVYDAMTYVKDPARLVENPKFNVDAAIQDIAIHASDLHTKDFGAFARGVDKLGKTRIVRTYDNYLNVFQRQHRRYGPLTFVRNMVGDTIGTAWQLIVKGEGTAAKMNPVTLGRKTHAYRSPASDEVLQIMHPHMTALDADAMRKASKRDPQAFRIAESLDDPNVRGTGQLIPMKLIPGSSRGEDLLGGLPSANARARALGPLRHIANLWSVPYGKDYLNTIDNLSRTDMWKQHYNRLWRDEGLKSFKKTLDELAGDPSISADWMQRIARQAQRKTGDGPWSGSFSPDDVRTALKGVTKHDTALSRAWQGQLVKASDSALKRTEDVLFTYKNTNADELARRIFVFHYWQTRAYPLHVRAALRNPILLVSYYKMWQELEAMAERDNYPPYFNNMLRFAQTPDGISMYGNPMDLLIPMTVTDLHDEKGNKLQALAQQMSPMIVGALAATGLVDNTVDMTGLSSTENFIRKLNNYLVAEGIDPTQLPFLGQFFDPLTLDLNLTVEEFQQAVIDRINEVFGQPLGDYQPFDRGANELDQLRTWVQVEAVEQYGPRYDAEGNLLWTDEQMAEYEEAMIGTQSGLEGNPLLDGATENFGTEDGISALLGLFIPGGAVVNSQQRTDMMKSASEYASQGFTGTPEQQAANDFRQEAKASDPAWSIANTQYHQIGTDDQRQVNDLYNDMIYEPQSFRERTVIVPDGQGGYTTLDLSGLVNMSEDERRAFADNYLAQIGMTESIDALRQEKDDFKTANPEYGQYSEYQKTVGDSENQPGGTTAWRESLAETNPNFRQAMEEKKQELLDRGVSRKLIDYELNAWAMSQDAYFAAMGMQQGIYDEKPGSVYDPSSDPLNNPALAGMRPPVETVETVEGGGGSGGAAEETGKSEKEWTLYKGDTVEKGSAHAIQLAEHETLGNLYLANQAAEALYGDEWDYDAVAASGEFGDGWVNKDHPRTNYYGDSSPTDATMAKRYREWQQVTGSNGSVDEWLAWEAGLREGFIPPGVMSSQQVAASPAMQAAAIRLGATVPPAPQSGMMNYAGGASFDPSKGSYGPTQGSYGGGSGDALGTMFGGTTDVSFEFGAPNDLGYYAYGTHYGMDGSAHTGIDVPQPYGSPIYAPADAEVVCVGCWQNGYDQANGQVGRIELEMPDGVHILYDHSLDSTVQDGDYVSAGQQIGANGNGNDGSPHTHLEVRVPDASTPSGWRLIDPLPYLESIS
jgi:hypothetical protein